MSTWHGVMADEEKLSRCKTSTDTVCDTPKTPTKYANIVRGTPTLKDVERFQFGTGPSANPMKDLFMSEYL